MNIQIKRPCSQNWDQMSPVARGRHCQACGKNVADFTAMSDEEVLRYLASSRSEVCGRLTAAQLTSPRPLLPWKRILSPRWQWLFALLLGYGKSYGQSPFKIDTIAKTVSSPADTDHMLTAVLGCIIAVPKDKIVPFYIRIVNASGHPCPYASVSIAGHGKWTSDAEGSLMLDFPGRGRRLWVSVKAVGYQPVRRRISRPRGANDEGQAIEIRLETESIE